MAARKPRKSAKKPARKSAAKKLISLPGVSKKFRPATLRSALAKAKAGRKPAKRRASR
jgi:hypothetical protein